MHGTGLEGFLAECAQRGFASHVACCAAANPSGRVEQSAFEEFATSIVDGVTREGPSLRAVLLDLHGAMCTSESDDAEGDLLRRVREAAPPEAVIGVCLDLHGNISDDMVRHSDVMAGYQTYPHVDMRETGVRVARALFDHLLPRGRSFPLAKSLVSLPMLSHTLCSRTDVPGAMLTAVNAAKRMEEEGRLVCGSIFAGFALADTPHTAVSVTCYGHDQKTVDECAEELRREIWQHREGFVFRPESVEKSLQRVSLAERVAHKYVLLLDHADNVMSGAQAASTALLRLLPSVKKKFLCGPICDAALAASCVVGARGRFVFNDGFAVDDAEVTAVSESGSFKVTGPIFNGSTFVMGRSAALRLVDGSVVTVSSIPVEAYDRGVFSVLNLDPTLFELVVLKSRMYCRPVFAGDASEVLLIDCGHGLSSSHFEYFDFARLRRPVFPLDVPLTLAAVREVSVAATESAHLGPIVTRTEMVQEGGFRFAVRVVTSLELKKRAAEASSGAPEDPFAVPEPALLIPECDAKLPRHRAMLNKFPIIEGHALLTTREFRSQNEPLLLEDFEALSVVSDGFGWLMFYNCGPFSGRSQPHKHVQLVPYPFDDAATHVDRVNFDALSFAHGHCRIESWRDAKGNWEKYLSLMDTLQQGEGFSCSSHNVIMTQTSLFVIPRSSDNSKDAGLNGLAFAWTLLAHNEEDKRRIVEEGPMNILKKITFPKKQ